MTTESIEQSPARASLWRKLAAVTAAVPPVRPTGYNNDIKKKYADSDDIVTTLRPLLAEHQLAITLQVNAVRREETGQKTSNGAPFILTEIDCTFIIADGETGETLAVPWSADAADHMKDKGLPKALTIARRTFLIHTFHIIAEEEKQLWEGEQQSAQRQAPPQRPASQANGAGGTMPQSAADAEQRFFARYADSVGGGDWAAVQRYLGSRAPKPTTVGGWIAAADAVRDQARETLLIYIGELTEQVEQLDLEIKLLKPLDEMTGAELNKHRANLEAAIEGAKRPGRAPSESLPTATTA